MRSDIVLMATVDGEPLEFIARDVPTGVFFAGFQDTFPGAPCYAELSVKEQWANILGFEDWTDTLLARALVPGAAGLNAGRIRSLGTARDELAVGYLWGIGYQVPPPSARERLVPPGYIPAPILRDPVLADEVAFRELPPPNIRRLLQQVARGARRPTIKIWEDWTISEFVKEWRQAHQDDMKKRDARGRGSLPQSDVMDTVGRERS